MLQSTTDDSERPRDRVAGLAAVIQVSRDAARWDGTVAERGRQQFDAHHWLRLPAFLAPPVLADLQRAIRTARFVETVHEGVSPPSVDVCMEPHPAAALLELLCNDPVVFAAVEAVTGCAPLTRFSGFVYRLSPDKGHHHHWHNDLVHDRRVALSVNLEPEPYEGGVLQIRRRDSGEIIERVENVRPGDAILFRIDAALQHRATPVTAGIKTAFAGWFRSGPSLRDALAHLASSRG
jgi:hypothetical protein